MQSLNTWKNFIHKNRNDIIFKNNVGELYFEQDDIAVFVAKLFIFKDLDCVHPLLRHPWGQRVVRFYDPDQHIIEVGENIVIVVRKFLRVGLSIEETAIQMDVPVD